MAHNLEYNSKRGTTSFFSRKELAWHDLGQVIQTAVAPDEALRLANLDYEVKLFPLWSNFIPEGGKAMNTADGKFALYDSNGLYTGEVPSRGKKIETNKAICRTDNYETLGVVGNRYTPVQNKDSVEFIYNILKYNPDIKEHNDIIIETAGALGKGERIFVTAKLPKGFTIGEEKESTELYVVFTNAHDGTSSLTAMVTPIRVVCNNTLTAAIRNNKSKVSFRHTTNIKSAMTEGMSLLNISYKAFEQNQELYNALLNIKVDSKLLDDLVFKAMLPDNKYMLVKTYGINNVSTDDVSTRLRNTLQDARDFIDYGAGQNTNRGTAYWAYMGINSYINNGINHGDALGKFDNLMGGTSYTLDNKVLNTVMQLL